MVLAEHYTPVGPFVTTTLETVRFAPLERVHFRLARGPVPSVVEEFRPREVDGGTELECRGELATDLWLLGGCGERPLRERGSLRSAPCNSTKPGRLAVPPRCCSPPQAPHTR